MKIFIYKFQGARKSLRFQVWNSCYELIKTTGIELMDYRLNTQLLKKINKL
jgi:hypothetical protein